MVSALESAAKWQLQQRHEQMDRLDVTGAHGQDMVMRTRREWRHRMSSSDSGQPVESNRIGSGPPLGRHSPAASQPNYTSFPLSQASCVLLTHAAADMPLRLEQREELARAVRTEGGRGVAGCVRMGCCCRCGCCLHLRLQRVRMGRRWIMWLLLLRRPCLGADRRSMHGGGDWAAEWLQSLAQGGSVQGAEIWQSKELVMSVNR